MLSELPDLRPIATPRRRIGGRALGLTLTLVVFGGCGDGPQRELVGEAALESLPAELSRLMPAGLVLMHHEQADEPTGYDLWLVRGDESTHLDLPADLRGVERHELPASILVGMLKAKRPGLDLGTPRGDCRFTHWDGPSDKFQVRELLTDRGWFASLEWFHPR